LLIANLFRNIRKKRDASRLFNRQSQRSLVFRACARYAAGKNLPSLGDKPAKRIRFLIIYLHLLGAEFTDFLFEKNFAAFSAPGALISVAVVHLHIHSPVPLVPGSMIAIHESII
jgi:hypothetical protein